jgi:hypothetical protein
LKNTNKTSAVLKIDSAALKVAKADKNPARAPTTDEDKELLLQQMAFALCRQYIMWPTTGELPCQKGIDCDKSASCRKMAEDVVDYASSFPKD